MKPCNRCGKCKELHEFVKAKRMADGRLNTCKACRNEESRKPDGRVRRRQMEWHYRKKYGISFEQAQADMARGCEICGSNRDMVIDHDHSTGTYRGPLCDRCNRALGYLDDDPDRLRAAADYLEFHRDYKA